VSTAGASEPPPAPVETRAPEIAPVDVSFDRSAEHSGVDTSAGLSFIDQVAPPENSEVVVSDSMVEEANRKR
jgi:hypothetical protein